MSTQQEKSIDYYGRENVKLIAELNFSFPTLCHKYELGIYHSGGGCWHVEYPSAIGTILINPYDEDIDYEVPRTEDSQCMFAIDTQGDGDKLSEEELKKHGFEFFHQSSEGVMTLPFKKGLELISKIKAPKTYLVEFKKEEVFELCQILKDYEGQEKCLDKDLNSAIKKLTTIEE